MSFNSFKGLIETSNLKEVLIAYLEKNPNFLQCAPVKIRRESAADFLKGENPEESHRLPVLREMVELFKEGRKPEYYRLIAVGAEYVGISYKNGEISFKDEEELYFADFDKLAVIGAYIEKFLIPEMGKNFKMINDDEVELLIMALKNMDSEDFLKLAVESFIN